MSTLTWILAVVAVMCVGCQARAVDEVEKENVLDKVILVAKELLKDGLEMKRTLVEKELQDEKDKQKRELLHDSVANLMTKYIEKRATGMMIVKGTGDIQTTMLSYDEATRSAYAGYITTLLSSVTLNGQSPSNLALWTNQDEISVSYMGDTKLVSFANGNTNSKESKTAAEIVSSLEGSQTVAIFEVTNGVVASSALTSSTANNLGDLQEMASGIMEAANAWKTSTNGGVINYLVVHDASFQVEYIPSSTGSSNGLMWVVSK